MTIFEAFDGLYRLAEGHAYEVSFYIGPSQETILYEDYRLALERFGFQSVTLLQADPYPTGFITFGGLWGLGEAIWTGVPQPFLSLGNWGLAVIGNVKDVTQWL